MKISPKKLTQIQNQEYEEYITLKKKSFDGEKYKLTAFVLLHIFFSSIIFYFLTKSFEQEYYLILFIALLFVSLFPVFWLPTWGIVALLRLEPLFLKIYKYFLEKTYNFQRYKDLEEYFLPIEKQIEAEAILILSKVEKEARIRLAINININNYLYNKKKPEQYLYEIEKATKNYKLNQKSLVIVNENIDYIKCDKSKHKQFKVLEYLLRTESIKWVNKPLLNQNFKSKLSKVQKTTKIVSSKTNVSKNKSPINISTNKTVSSNDNLKNENKSNAIKSNVKLDGDTILGKNQNRKIDRKKDNQSTSKKTTENHPRKTAKTSIQLDLDFETPKIKLQDIDDVPKKRSTPHFEPIIKASPEFYKELADKKIG